MDVQPIIKRASQPTPRFVRRFVGVATAGVLILAACGDDDDDDAASASPTTVAEEEPPGTDTADEPTETDAPPETDPSPDTTATDGAGEDPSGDAEYAAYCAESLELEQAFSELDFEAPQDGLAALVPQAEALLELAPDEIRADGEVLVDTLRDVAAGGDPEAFESPEVMEAEGRIGAFEFDSCGWNQVEITGLDYSFAGELPTDAGVAGFQFSNEGEEAHVMIIGRKKDDVTVSAEEAFMGVETEEQFDEVFEFVTETFAPPGGSSHTVADLAPGEYVMFCPIPVGTDMEHEGDGPPHFVEGMVETFTVG